MRVIGISRKGEPLPDFESVYSGYLGNPLVLSFQEEKIDAFLHCAYHSGKDDYQINVQGTRLWAEQAEKNGVRKQIFVSSLTARGHSLSSYGKAKYDLEKWFLQRGHLIIRPGLVLGPGGSFQKMVGLVRRSPILPLPDGGKTAVHLIGIQFLCDVMKEALIHPSGWPGGKTWNLFLPDPVTFKDLLAAIRKSLGTKCFFVPVPSLLLRGVLGILEYLPCVKLGISRNNLIGLKQNEQLAWSSDLKLFDRPLPSLEELVDEAIRRD